MKISDKLIKVDNDVTINKYDNGFVVHFNGRDSADDWKNAKIVCNTLDEVIALLREFDKLEQI